MVITIAAVAGADTAAYVMAIPMSLAKVPYMASMFALNALNIN